MLPADVVWLTSVSSQNLYKLRQLNELVKNLLFTPPPLGDPHRARRGAPNL